MLKSLPKEVTPATFIRPLPHSATHLVRGKQNTPRRAQRESVMKSFRLFKSVSLPFLFSFALAASAAPQDILLNPRLRNQKPTPPPPSNAVPGPVTSDPVAADAGK